MGTPFFVCKQSSCHKGLFFLSRNSARVVACFVKIPTLVMRYFMTSKEWPHFGDGPERFFPHYTDVLLCPVAESFTDTNGHPFCGDVHWVHTG